MGDSRLDQADQNRHGYLPFLLNNVLLLTLIGFILWGWSGMNPGNERAELERIKADFQRLEGEYRVLESKIRSQSASE